MSSGQRIVQIAVVLTTVSFAPRIIVCRTFQHPTLRMIVVRAIAVRVELVLSWRNRQISEIEQNRLVRFIRRMKIKIHSEVFNILRGTTRTIAMNAIRGNCNYTAVMNILAKLRCQMRNDSVE
jgi:hypothetical protein